jgi:hypothetical protein
MSLEHYEPKPQGTDTQLKKEEYPLANDYDDDYDDVELNKPVNSATRIKPKPKARADRLKKEDIYPLGNDHDDDILYKPVNYLNTATKIKPVEQKKSFYGKLFFNKTSKITGKPTEDTVFDRPGLGGKKTKKHKRTMQDKKTKKHKSRKNKTKRRRRF